MMTCIMACKCGNETECTWEQMKLGSIWKCPGCEEVTVAISGNRGKVWVTIDPSEVKFYGILDPIEDEVVS